MPSALKLIAAFCGTGVLLGCTSNPKTAETTIVPAMRVQHSYESADGHYALGRYFHGAQRVEEAQKAYRQALALRPDHAKAGNALAVLYAETGDLRQAAELLQKLTAAMPDAAHLFSNLGRVYFLDGQYEAARQALEKATALDPGNTQAWNNLGSVLEKLGHEEQSRQTFARARTSTSAPAPSAPPANTAMKTAPAPSVTQVQALGPGLYEVLQAPPTRTPAGTDALPVSSSLVRALTSATPARVEVSNGNGVNGMAKSVGKMIQSAELKVVRLTNQKHFSVKVTQIEYNPGYERTARGLADRFGPSVIAKPGTAGPAADVRIVLGKDLPDARTLGANYTSRDKRAATDHAQAS